VIKRFGVELSQRSAALDSIKGELSRGRLVLEQLQRQEQSSLQQLEQFESTIALAEQYQAKLGDALDSAERNIATLQHSLVQQNSQLRYRQHAMQMRMRAMYMSGAQGVVQQLLSAQNVADMLRKIRYFQQLKRYDIFLMRSIDSSRVVLERSKAMLELERDQQLALKNEKSAEQQQLELARANHQKVLIAIRSEKQAYEQMVKDLQEAQEQLLALITQLEKRKQAAQREYERSLTVKFEKRKGQLIWPVQGAVLQKFGKVIHPVYKTVTLNNGIDILGRAGQSVSCVAPGTVVYVGRMRGLGRFMVVDHSGGYMSIYANLATVGVNAQQTVEAGMLLGTIGEPQVSQEARLHFEIRQSTESLDPQQWLKAQ
jgi:septal ring factor EnvC (AmiA/AmiB activator)